MGAIGRTAAVMFWAAACAACSEDTVSLGAWGALGRTCGVAGEPGPKNDPGAGIGVSIPYTRWTWPSTSDSMEWELTVESQTVKDGYFWTHEFLFEGGNAHGLFGLQARGGYQADPPDGPVELTSMVVFWISSSPIRAELGDIQYPDGRTYLQLQRGSQWWTIHVRYAWKPCQTYAFRVGLEATEATGDLWYGAWVRDGATGVETFVGRILVPAAFGKLTENSSMWTNRIGYSALRSCDDPEPASASFGFPTANGGTVRPTSYVNQVDAPLCPTSRFTELPGAIRQEVGLSLRSE
jgi:hypothetical protein